MTLYLPHRYAPKCMPQVKILPTIDQKEFIWLCNKCQNPNLMQKDNLGENRAFQCHQCGYTWALGSMPDDIKYFMKQTASPEVNVRPRIVRGR